MAKKVKNVPVEPVETPVVETPPVNLAPNERIQVVDGKHYVIVGDGEVVYLVYKGNLGWSRKLIQKHRRCPVCFGERKGTGQQYAWNRVSGRMTKLYYRCNQCGHTWVAEVIKTTNIVSNDVEVDHNDIEDIETREG